MRSVTVSPLALDLPFQFRIPHSALRTQRECPRLAQRSLTSLSAAPCEGLTLFTSGRPADLGHPKLACRLRVLYGQCATPGTGCFATVTLRSRRWPDATITRLVEPSSRGSTRTRLPEASVPTNAMRSTPRSPGAAWRPVTGAALANPSCAVTRSTTTPRGANATRLPNV